MSERRARRAFVRSSLRLALCALALGGIARPISAQQSVCAIAQISLGQQAALEREAFNAHLDLSNNQAAQSLTNLGVTISIKDAAGNPADALFFTKVTNLNGASAIDGTGTVQPNGQISADWLIIPSTGAGGSLAAGNSYSVSAQISYISAGVPNTNVTIPATITVYPQPSLNLEYALPFEVFSVDPFTLTGATVPFPLGLRVTNVGFGTANNFQITSGQPVITDNRQGLPVTFQILGTFLGSNALPNNTFTIPYGNLPPGGSSLAAWEMTSSFSGRFTNFVATFTHSAALGGALTSLVQSVTTYTLVKDVLDDTPGHDQQFDLLVNTTLPRNLLEALYQTGLEVQPDSIMESDRPGFTPVTNASAHLTGALSGYSGVLTLAFDQAPTPNSWVHASIPFVQGSSVTLVSAVRSDGKAINPRNAWITPHINKLTNTRTYFLDLLDYTAAQPLTYALTFNVSSLQTPPDPISNLSVSGLTPGGFVMGWNATGAAGSTGTIIGGQYAIFASTDLTATPNVAAAAVSFSTATAPFAPQSYALSGLLGNATYQLDVFLANAAGQFSRASNKVIGETLANPPSGIIVSSVSSSAFSLGWNITSNASGAQYQVQLASGTGSVITVVPYTADLSSASFAGLNPNQTYFVAAQEKNSAQLVTPAATIATVTTLALPPGTTSPSFVGVTTTTAIAQWLAEANPADTEFWAELSTAPARAPVFAASGWVRASSFAFTGLPPGTSFYGQVKARNRALAETAFVDLGTVKTAPLDSLPPRTSLTVGAPSFNGALLFVTTSTPLGLSAVDDKTAVGDGVGVGVARTYYAVDSSTFAAYSGTFTLVAQGTHTITFYSVDLVGNTEVARSSTVAVDAAPPSVAFSVLGSSFTDAAGNLDVSTTTVFALLSVDPLVNGVASGVRSTQYQVNGGSFAVYGGTFSFSAPDGARQVAFQATDNVGNASLLKSATVFLDATPPVSALAIGAPQYASSGTVYVSTLTALSLSAVDPVVNGVASGVRGIAVAQSTAAFAAYAGTFTLTAPDGPKGMSWYSADDVGNQEIVRSSTVILDATAPQTSLAVLGGHQFPGPDAGSFYASSGTRFALLAADPLVNGAASGVAWTKYQDGTGASLTYVSTFALAEGAHKLGYQSQDNVANLEVLRSTTVFVDAAPPVTTVSVGSPTYTAPDGTVYVTPASPVTFTASDPALPTGQPGSGVARIEVSVDSAAFTVYTASLTFPEGRHTVAYRSVDDVGNVEATRTLALQSDATPPVTTLAVSTPSFNGFVSAATLFSLSGVDPAVNGAASGVAFTRYRVNGGAFAAAPLAFRLTGPDGAYQVDYQSQDNVANMEVLRSTAVFLDQTPPVTAPHIGAPSYVASDGTQYLTPATPVTFTAVDPSSDALASGVHHVEVALDGGAFSVYAATLTFAEGRHSILYRAVDNVGNVEVTKTLNVQSDATAPITAFKTGGTYYTANAPEGPRLYAPLVFTYSLPATDPIVSNVASGLAITRYRTGQVTNYASGAPAYAPGAFANYASTSSLAEGIRRVDFQSQDNVGNLELLKSATVFVDATPPVTALSIGAPQYAAGGMLYVSTVTPFSLASQDPVVSEVASGVSGVFFHLDAAAFAAYASTFTMPVPDGARTVNWYAADNVGNLETVKTSTVALDATPPLTALGVIGGRQFPGPNNVTFYASADTRFALTAVDPIVNGVASGLAWTRWQDNGGTFSAYLSTLTLTEGAHALGYQSQDNVANLEVLRSTNIWIDATPPVTTVAIGSPTYTAADGTIYVTPATPITFAASDPSLPTGQAGSGVNRIEVSLDGGVYAPYTAALKLPEGRHTILYRAVDDVANVEVYRTLAVQSDATPPASSLVVGQPRYQLPNVLLVSSRTSFSIVAADPVTNNVASGVKDTYYRVSDVSPSTAAFATFAVPFAMAGADVNKVIEFYSRDNVLNTEVVKSSTVLLDSTPPEVALLSPAACDSGICRVLKGKFPVLGTARDLHFASYVLDSAPGQNAAAGFVTISSDTVAVSSGALGTWDASALSGWQTLRLTATDLVANVTVLTVDVFVGDPGELMTLGNHEVFDMPEGVAVGMDGKIYVADRDNSRVAIFSSTGVLLSSFGGRGHDDDDRVSTGTLRLHEPSGVAVDAAGNIYVADTDRDRVLKLSATGQILLNLGRPEREHEERRDDHDDDHNPRLPGRFHHPAGVAVDANQNIFVADTDNRRVQVFSSTGGFTLQFDLPAVPVRPDRDDDGDPRGDHDDGAGIANLGKPFGIALDAANNIYIADPKGGRALKFGATGQLLLTIPITGDKPGSIGRPFGVAVSTSGECVLVSDRKYSRILKFDVLGSQNLTFGTKGKLHDDAAPAPSGSIVLRKPMGLALDAAGGLFVADRNNDRVRKFALPTGRPPLVVPPSKPDDDHSARDVVDKEDGGKVERKDRAAVDIPAGAVLQDLQVTVSTPSASVADESSRQHAVDAAQLKPASPPVEYGPEGTKFGAPVTLTLPYSPELAALQGVDEADLTVRYWNRDKAQWENLDSVVDPKTRTVKAKTTHFSLYQVFSGTASPAALKPLAAADPTFMYHDAYAFPNPVRGTSVVTIRMQTGLADSVEVRAYDVSGRKVYSSSNFTLNPAFDDGNGKGVQYTYDNVWDISGIGSGVYTYVITAKKAGASDIHKTGRLGVIK